MHELKRASLYFALVFAAGFALGPIRVLWLAPRVGERAAEFAEAPFMLLAIFLAARFVLRRHPPGSRAACLATGGAALALLLAAELSVVLWLRGLTLAEYVAGRDPVAGVLYLVLLLVFALMPYALAHVPRGD